MARSKSPAYITVLHNGVLTLNHFELLGNTPFNEPPKYEKHGKLPIHLQDHGNPVRYRNIWVREIKPIEGKQVREPYFHDQRQGNADCGDDHKGSRGNQINGKPVNNGRITLRSEEDRRECAAT